MAITDLLVKLSKSFTNNPLLLKIVTSVILLFIGFIAGKIVGKIILQILKKLDFDKTIRKATGYEFLIAKKISNIVSYIIYFLAIILFLENLGLTSLVLDSILLIILLVIGISVILAIKDFIPNFMAGYSLKNKELFNIGDKIKAGQIEGKIVKLNLLDTHLKTKKDDLMIIPNSFFIKNVVVKKSR